VTLVAAFAVIVAGIGASVGYGRSDAAATAQKHTIKVGIVYSRTGLLSAYGAEYIEGLRLGLAYATKGTNKVNGRKIELTLRDDAGVPATGVSAAKDLIGQGYKIIAGSTSSGVGLQVASIAAQNRVLFISGPAATDALTGLNRYTFRSGRQTWQDVLAAGSFLKGAGRKVLVFAQDTAFGQGNAAAVDAVLGPKHKVSRILVPLSANDFTPFARQAKEAKPALIYVAWAGTTTGAMWQAMQQQGVFKGTKVVTGLAERSTWQSYGPASSRISFLSHYVSTGPRNKVNNWLVRAMRKRSHVADLFTPDGFTAAQMIVRALQKAKGDDVDKMISALQGYRFTSPKGAVFVRPSDHALIQPMFQARLVKSRGKFTAKVTKRIGGVKVAPPVKRFPT
jgi:branched-chain amino acid transport system substrate-binding protein